jgi:hypothetical protein
MYKNIGNVDPGIALAIKGQWREGNLTASPHHEIPPNNNEQFLLKRTILNLVALIGQSDSILHISGVTGGRWFDWTGSGRDYRACMGRVESCAQRSGRIVDGSCPWTEDG